MNKKIWDDAHKRAAEMAPVRADRRMRDILYGDVPTFMELPHAITTASSNQHRTARGTHRARSIILIRDGLSLVSSDIALPSLVGRHCFL